MPSDRQEREPSRRRAEGNRWTEAIDRSPSVGTALGGFSAYLGGALLLMIAVLLALPGLLLVVGTIGSGWPDRLGGVALIAGSVVVFAAGWWLTNNYAVQRRG